MSYPVHYSAQARDALIDIYTYIAIENHAPDNADRLLSDLETRVDSLLSEQPRAGRAWKDNTRFIVVKRYVVLYEILDAEVLILNIFPPRTNWR